MNLASRCINWHLHVCTYIRVWLQSVIMRKFFIANFSLVEVGWAVYVSVHPIFFRLSFRLPWWSQVPALYDM